MRNSNKSFKSGFTLIELLVVVAIIGVLSSVVLASLNTARAKGADAAAKANLANIRASAEMFYDTNSGYSTATIAVLPLLAASCATATGLFDSTVTNNGKAGITAAEAATGNSATCMLGGTSGAKATTWAASIQLKTAATYWCVDSTGVARSTTAAGAAYTSSAIGAAPATIIAAGNCN